MELIEAVAVARDAELVEEVVSNAETSVSNFRTRFKASMTASLSPFLFTSACKEVNWVA